METYRINPKHTVPSLEFTDEIGKKVIEDNSIQVCKELDKISGTPQLYTDKNANEIDTYVKDMHDNADVGNTLFFTSRDPAELTRKKGLIVPFIQGRIQGFETYSKQAPEHKSLYDAFLNMSKNMAAQYQGEADAKPLFDMNAQNWTKLLLSWIKRNLFY